MKSMQFRMLQRTWMTKREWRFGDLQGVSIDFRRPHWGYAPMERLRPCLSVSTRVLSTYLQSF
jgi:hypothetical protein